MSSNDLINELTKKYSTDKHSKLAERGRVLALKSDISEAISQGWSLKQIWSILFEKSQITCGYSTFCYYVKRYVLSKEVVEFSSEPVSQVLSSTARKRKFVNYDQLDVNSLIFSETKTNKK